MASSGILQGQDTWKVLTNNRPEKILPGEIALIVFVQAGKSENVKFFFNHYRIFFNVNLYL